MHLMHIASFNCFLKVGCDHHTGSQAISKKSLNDHLFYVCALLNVYILDLVAVLRGFMGL